MVLTAFGGGGGGTGTSYVDKRSTSSATASSFVKWGGYTFSDSTTTSYMCNNWLEDEGTTTYTWPTATCHSLAGDTHTIQLDIANAAYERIVQRVYRQMGDGWIEVTPKKTPQERLREIIQKRNAPMILTERKSLLVPTNDREVRARGTLRRLLGEDKFFRFLKDGFITVRAKSGLSYQIFPAHGITAVYRDGLQVERLCVVLRGDFPPTDSLIMRYLVILNDENRFRSYAIKHQVVQKSQRLITGDQRSLTDIFKEIKKVA